jgi:hypothetical protein
VERACAPPSPASLADPIRSDLVIARDRAGERRRREIAAPHGTGAGDDNGAGGVTSLPPELALKNVAFVFLVWIGMEKAGAVRCLYTPVKGSVRATRGGGGQ